VSAFSLTHTCAACGAEESLDSLLLRLIDDDVVRRLIADVLVHSLPLGGQVVSYLRLHKPPKQRLRMAGVAKILAELVPDIRRGAITRKGREWQAGTQAWQAAFAAVFEARDKGLLDLPLEGNAYLYEVLLRQADRAEGQAEREQQQAARSRAHTGGPRGVAGTLGAALGSLAQAADAHADAGAGPSGVDPLAEPQRWPFAVAVAAPVAQAAMAAAQGPSPAARRIQEEIRAKLAARTAPPADASATANSSGDAA